VVREVWRGRVGWIKSSHKDRLKCFVIFWKWPGVCAAIAQFRRWRISLRRSATTDCGTWKCNWWSATTSGLSCGSHSRGFSEPRANQTECSKRRMCKWSTSQTPRA